MSFLSPAGARCNLIKKEPAESPSEGLNLAVLLAGLGAGAPAAVRLVALAEGIKCAGA